MKFFVIWFAIFFKLGTDLDESKAKESYHVNNVKRECAKLARGDYPSDSTTYSVEEYGSYVPLLTFVKHSLTFSVKMYTAINKGWADFYEVYTPQYLCTHENIMRAKERLVSLSDVINHCEKEFYAEHVFLETEVNKMFPGDNEWAKGRRKAFGDSEQQSFKELAIFFQIEKDCCQAFHDILDFLAAKSGTFSWNSNNNLVLENKEELSEYNNLILKLDEQMKKETLIIEKMQSIEQMHRRKMETCSLTQ